MPNPNSRPHRMQKVGSIPQKPREREAYISMQFTRRGGRKYSVLCAFFIFCVLWCFDILKNLSVGDTALPGPAHSQGRQRAQPGHTCDLQTNPGHASSVCPVPERQYTSAFSIPGQGQGNQEPPQPKAAELFRLARPDCSPHLSFPSEHSKGYGLGTSLLPSTYWPPHVPRRPWKPGLLSPGPMSVQVLFLPEPLL